MNEKYYMSPKIRGTEIYSHGFLEISGSDYIIVSRIFGDIWKINVSKNPWEYISVPRISWISRIFGDKPLWRRLVQNPRGWRIFEIILNYSEIDLWTCNEVWITLKEASAKSERLAHFQNQSKSIKDCSLNL